RPDPRSRRDRPDPQAAARTGHGRGRGMITALPLPNFATDFWTHPLVDHGRQGVFLVLVGFVGSFAFIRFSTRMIRAEVSWWPGNIERESGLPVTTLLFGVL